MPRWGYSYPWGSCLERGTRGGRRTASLISMCVCMFVMPVVGQCVSCGGHTEPPTRWRGDATDAFHGCMPCARLRHGPRSRRYEGNGDESRDYENPLALRMSATSVVWPLCWNLFQSNLALGVFGNRGLERRVASECWMESGWNAVLL